MRLRDDLDRKEVQEDIRTDLYIRRICVYMGDRRVHKDIHAKRAIPELFGHLPHA
jgi:hypothetical protein